MPDAEYAASGPRYSVGTLAAGLRALGLTVTVVGFARAAQVEAPDPNLAGVRLRVRGPGGVLSYRTVLREVGRLTEGVDVLHMHSLWSIGTVAPAAIARRRKIPLMASPRGTLAEWALRRSRWRKRLFWYVVQRRALSGCQCLHATAEAEVLDFRRSGLRQPVAVIPNGLAVLSEPPSHDALRGGPTLLFLGRIHPKKGLDLLLAAWRSVAPAFPAWSLRVVGPDYDGYVPVVKRMVTALGLDRVSIEGPLLGADRDRAYQQASLFVLPTYSENFGMTVAEALAHAVPVVCTKGAPWESLGRHGCGWWVDVSAKAIEAGLREAMALPPSALRAMGERGHSFAKSEFSPARTSEMMRDTYYWMLGSKPKPEWIRE